MKRWPIGQLLVIMVIFLTVSCQSKEDKALLEQVKTREAAKMELIQKPARYVIPGQWDRYDKGLINSYTKATAIVFTNNSMFDVDEITGSMTYKSADDKVLATVPFMASGTIRTGQSVKLPVKAGEVTGAAEKALIVVEKVHIIGQ